MGLFSKIFTSKDRKNKKKGYHDLRVSEIKTLTPSMSEISFDISGLESTFQFTAGMHVHVAVLINDKEFIRSYSICGSGPNSISIGVKIVPDGIVSTYLCETLKVDDTISVSEPTGNFVLDRDNSSILAIAAGSGITPIISMLKQRELSEKDSILLFGNKTENEIPFKTDLDNLSKTKTHYFLSQEVKNGFENGRIDKQALSAFVKSDLSVLRYDGFYLCGPEELIVDSKEVLELFGVQKDKIHFELFTTPVLLKPESNSSENNFNGVAQVDVVLDGENISFELDSQGKSILDAVNDLGYDAPYSCRGGVCSTCKAKVTEGEAKMDINYALTDKEVEEGYILTCQAHPSCSNIKVSFDA